MPLSKQQIAIILAEKKKHAQGAVGQVTAPAIPKATKPILPSPNLNIQGNPNIPPNPAKDFNSEYKMKFPKIGGALKKPRY